MSGEFTAADALLAELEAVRADNARLREAIRDAADRLDTTVSAGCLDTGQPYIGRAADHIDGRLRSVEDQLRQALARQAVAEQNRAAGRSELP